ncbi:MAG: polysaccharide deacetylase family protein [Methyloceanibacter sp.]|jgi:peptidoglycan/xylan/chitin deacetylase (PgdA/CDA1 family)
MVPGKLASSLTMLLVVASIGIASAEEVPACPGNPHAVGVSRIIEVDTAGGPRLGTYQYPTTLDLGPKEVVLTFDDGPNPRTTEKVLDALDQHCVKATFFEVGKWVAAYPQLTKEVADRGHTLGSHSYSHPTNLGHLPLTQAEQDIDRGFAAMKEASGGRVAPFFRYPGLNNSDELNDFLGSRNIAVISCDIGTDDWMRIGAEQIVKRTLARLESKGKGIILFHDTEPATALALPTLLDELATRGYRIVHMVPKAEGVAALKPPDGASLKTP